MRKGKIQRGNASQFYVAAELCRRDFVAVVTMGNSPNTDILCSNAEGTKFVHIQVKTFRPGDNKCSVGLKSEKPYGKNFFWVLGGIPDPKQNSPFVYYIIPSSKMAKNIKESFHIWVKKRGKHGDSHDPKNEIRTVAIPPNKDLNGWDISPYKNRWELIEEKLK
jgi:hypothetical protein